MTLPLCRDACGLAGMGPARLDTVMPATAQSVEDLLQRIDASQQCVDDLATSPAAVQACMRLGNLSFAGFTQWLHGRARCPSRDADGRRAPGPALPRQHGRRAPHWAENAGRDDRALPGFCAVADGLRPPKSRAAT
jgi:hypothetical protein